MPFVSIKFVKENIAADPEGKKARIADRVAQAVSDEMGVAKHDVWVGFRGHRRGRFLRRRRQRRGVRRRGRSSLTPSSTARPAAGTVAMPDRILLPLIVACALFMENLDSTVLSTALPAIAADFGASPIHLKLALTSYLLALAVFIPASGWLADRYGARTDLPPGDRRLHRSARSLCGLSELDRRDRRRAHRPGDRRRDDGAGRPAGDPAERSRSTSSSARSPG